MKSKIFGIALLAGTATLAMPAQAQIPGSTCASSTAMSSAMAAAGAVVSLWSGGKATAPLQIAQQIQLVAQHICLQEQLIAQLKHLMTSPLNTAADIQGAMFQLRGLMGMGDATVYNLGRAVGVYRDQYPDDMTGMSSDEIIWQTEKWRTSSHRATEESWRIQSGAVEAQRASQVRVGRQLGAVQSAPGMLAAQQGTAQLIGSLIAETQSLQSVSMSHFRAVEHSLAKDQAREESAEEMHRRAMVGLGTNSRISVRSPF